MRTRSLLAGLLAMALAGCTGGTSQAPSVEPSPGPTALPAASPEPSLVILGVTVHWDGTKCTYLGPTVIRDGTTARFEYTFDEGTEPPLLVISGVRPATTWDMVLEGSRVSPISENVPDWVISGDVANIDAGTSALHSIDSDIGGVPVGGYFVGCATAPADEGGTDKMYPAALLEIAGP
jgi:hypothetical protein